MIDSHIHLDLYEEGEQQRLLDSLPAHGIQGLIAVSMHLRSCRSILELKRRSKHPIYASFGHHPEQPLPSKTEEERLFRWIREHQEEMTAIGEVGLPYYTRIATEARGERFDLEPYILLLDRFMQLAAELRKPIILHAVHEDADTACDLLDKHGVERAHFHWFKGSKDTLLRMKAKGYFISVTPDIIYKEKIEQIAKAYPLHLLMTETDGPWPFEGPFEGMQTHPSMMRDSIRKLSDIKKLSEEKIGAILFENTIRFYNLPLGGKKSEDSALEA